MKVREQYTCPLEIVHDIVKGKWKPIIIFQLSKEPKSSFSELERGINGITQKMLIEQLKELQSFGLVEKKSYEGYPLKVEYFLTERGKKISQAVHIMQEVGIEYMVEQGLTDILDEKGIPYHMPCAMMHTKK